MLNCFVDERLNTSPGVLRYKPNLVKCNSQVNEAITCESFTIDLEFFQLMIAEFLILFFLKYVQIELGVLFIIEYSWQSLRNFPVDELLRLQLANYLKWYFFLYFCECFSFKQFLQLLISLYLEPFPESGAKNVGEFVLLQIFDRIQ